MYGQSQPQQQYFNPNNAQLSGGHHHRRNGSHHHGSHSYQPQTQYGAPPQADTDSHLWQFFASVDADRSGSIDVTELQNALVNGKTF
jgi:hypothetical protein